MDESVSPVAVLRLERGSASEDELAALITVLLARRAPAPALAAAPSLWRDHAGALRAPLTPGPGSWRASGLPR